MRSFLVSLVLLAACGSDSAKVDAKIGDSAGSGSGGIDAAVTLNCADYCSKIASACTGANQQFSMPNQCMQTCSHYPVGLASDTTGNTLGCHFYHAGNAVADPNLHCIHAGPSGGGACGASCEDFCALVTEICPTQYPAVNTCMTTCMGFDATRPYSSTVQSGNNFACRMYHATAAAQNAGVHCPHTAMNSSVCVGPP
jgi:hypothetical protein